MRFNYPYFLFALCLLLFELLVATKLASSGLVRGSLGDFFVVIFLYFFVRSIYPAKMFTLSFYIFLFACIVELTQYFHLTELLGLHSDSLLSILMGNTFSLGDILMYLLGCLIAPIFDLYVFSIKFSKSA